MSVEIRKKKLAGLIREIRKARRIIVTAHANPEGDALGSALGLYLGLKALRKNAEVFNRDPVPQSLRFLPGQDKLRNALPPGNVDLAFVVDCGEIERVGTPEQVAWFNAQRVVFIDHHVTTQGKGASFVDSKAAATGELVYELLRALGVKITQAIAVNLFCAVSTDTGSFRYSNTSPRTLAICSELLAAGAKPWPVAQALYENLPLSSIRLLSEALSTLTLAEEGRVAQMLLTLEHFARAEATQEDTEGVVNYGRMIRGVEVSVLVKEIGKGTCKVSMRSRGAVDVAAICQAFGGGGHKAAAGCTMKGEPAELQRRVFDAVREAVRREASA